MLYMLFCNKCAVPCTGGCKIRPTRVDIDFISGSLVIVDSQIRYVWQTNA